MNNTTCEDCKLIDLTVIQTPRQGAITPIYNSVHVPFDIKRVYYLYDVPAGSERGGHAHKALQQLIIAASGSFDVVVDDGKSQRSFCLNRPSYGLYMPSMMWRELKNFSGGGICLVLASLPYDESDYYREYEQFIKEKWRNENPLP